MRTVKKGMVRDAETARMAAEVNELLRSIDQTLRDHMIKAEEGAYGGREGQALLWDLGAIQAELGFIRELVNGKGCEFCRVPNLRF